MNAEGSVDGSPHVAVAELAPNCIGDFLIPGGWVGRRIEHAVAVGILTRVEHAVVVEILRRGGHFARIMRA